MHGVIMKTLKHNIDKLEIKLLNSYKLNKLRTKWNQILFPCKSSRMFFIFGCQRSGTTILARVLGLVPSANLYGEGDQPYFYQKEHLRYLRLRPESEIRELLSKERNRYTLLKPLYESQNASDLIASFNNSKAIWIFRNYPNVINSHVNTYTDSHDGVSYINDMLRRKTLSWKNENLPDDIIELLDEYSNKDFSSETGYALFWLARNSLYFKLNDNPNVKLVNYEDMVSNPISELCRIFAFLGLPFKDKYAKIIHARSTAKQLNLPVDKKINDICNSMYAQLQKEVAFQKEGKKLFTK